MYYINNDSIQIHNADGLSKFQKKYPIFKDQTILDLIKFIDDYLPNLTAENYTNFKKELDGRFESVFSNISDIRSAIDWTLVPHEWAEKELSIWNNSWNLKSVYIDTYILHKGKSYGL